MEALVPVAAHSWGQSRMSREQPGKEHLYRDAVRATWLGLAINLLLGCANPTFAGRN